MKSTKGSSSGSGRPGGSGAKPRPSGSSSGSASGSKQSNIGGASSSGIKSKQVNVMNNLSIYMIQMSIEEHYPLM